MKFYNYNKKYISYWDKIKDNKLDAIIYFSKSIWFYKNGEEHNTKNASYIKPDGYKEFCLNNNYYGDNNKFTKFSWRRFVKLQAFL